MRVLITGANGQLGTELQRTASPELEVTGCSRAELDITDAGQVQSKFNEVAPELVINAAAYTAVDRAESERERAFAVNAAGAGNVARAAAEANCRVIHLSTDFVFDGRQSVPYQPMDMTNPQSVYGASKLAGEAQVLEASASRALVLRTAWIYSSHGANFVLTMLRLMRESQEISVVADQVGTPTWAYNLAETVWQLAAQPDLHGLYHWTDSGVASWYDFAVAIQEEAMNIGLLSSAVAVRSVKTAQRSAPAPRPSFSVLDKQQTLDALPGLDEHHWRSALRAMLKELTVS
jgi:dTDP-4-dehydrorhamnose reductase